MSAVRLFGSLPKSSLPICRVGCLLDSNVVWGSAESDRLDSVRTNLEKPSSRCRLPCLWLVGLVASKLSLAVATVYLSVQAVQDAPRGQLPLT
jgi:hypothetical protein